MFSVDCTCEWCGFVVKLELKQQVVNLKETLPDRWKRSAVFPQPSTEGLGFVDETLCPSCNAEKAEVTREAEEVRKRLMVAAKNRCKHGGRLEGDHKMRTRERQKASDGYAT